MQTNEAIYYPNNLTPSEIEALKEDLKHFGYLLPTSDEEWEEFQKIYGTTQVLFPEHLKDTSFLHKSKENKLKPVKKTGGEKKSSSKATKAKQGVVKPLKNTTYFKKLVLAAEIANQLHQEYTFSHVKFVKILYLCEMICQMQLGSNYGKFAAGPLDPKSLYSIDAEFKKRKWFNITRWKYGFKYTPSENLDAYKKYYLNYFSNQQENINHIINLFRKEKTDFCERVATLFAVWKEQLEKRLVVTEGSLIKGFYGWSDDKKKFKEDEVVFALTWMKEKEIVPII